MSVWEPPAAVEQFPVPVAPRRRRRRWPAVLLVVVLALGGAAGTGALVIAQRDYTQAADHFNAVVDEAQDAQTARVAAVTSGTTAAHEADALATLASAGFTDATAGATLAADAEALDAAVAAAGAGLDVPAYAARRPQTWWPPAIHSATAQLRDEAELLASSVGQTWAVTETVASAAAKVTTSRGALLASVAPVSAQVDAANDMATNDSRFAFRDAAAAVDPTSGDPVAALTMYVQAGQALVASQAAEEAELDGPLRARKVAVVEFARSIDGGVLLDFSWAPTLSIDGQTWGRAGSLAGWTQFWFDRGGYATISLTDSVAAQWPTSKSLVVHEVGHAIQTKCPDLADHSTRAAVEAWATAWAIGMGYTDPGNGTQAYGEPPASLVEVSKSCR